MKTNSKYAYIIRRLRYLLVICVLTLFSASCSTGIESTKKIRMTKEDVRLMAKSPEQIFAEAMLGTPLSTWEKGRRFLATSDRTQFIFEPSGLQEADTRDLTAGNLLSFTGIDSHVNPDLREECVILFSDGQRTYRYRTGKTSEAALREIDSSRLPLLADIELASRWKDKLSGKTLWTKSNIWYDEQGNRVPGLKFAEVSIEDVEVAIGDFPIKIKISTPEGREGYLNMNYTSDIHDSRNFAALFYLSDPRDRFPHVSDEHWEMIQKGKVAEGMTKDECKLSIGNPDEVRSGHNRSQTMDIWQYTDGTYLMFTDGLLTNFRQ